jgi:hypothetical protein
MKEAILVGLVFCFAGGASAQTQEKGFMTFLNPRVSDSEVSKKSNYDGVCKALMGEGSRFVDGSAAYDRVKMNPIDTNTVQNNLWPHFFHRKGGSLNTVVVDETGQVVKVIARRSSVLRQISCWGLNQR